jgi:hypothetical protein
MHYIAFAFLIDFLMFPLSDFRHAVLYVPFAALATGPLLKLAALVRKCSGTRTAPVG